MHTSHSTYQVSVLLSTLRMAPVLHPPPTLLPSAYGLFLFLYLLQTVPLMQFILTLEKEME